MTYWFHPEALNLGKRNDRIMAGQNHKSTNWQDCLTTVSITMLELDLRPFTIGHRFVPPHGNQRANSPWSRSIRIGLEANRFKGFKGNGGPWRRVKRSCATVAPQSISPPTAPARIPFPRCRRGGRAQRSRGAASAHRLPSR